MYMYIYIYIYLRTCIGLFCKRTCQLRKLACAHGLACLFCKRKNPAKVGLIYKRDLQIYMYCMDWHDSFTKVGLFYK